MRYRRCSCMKGVKYCIASVISISLLITLTHAESKIDQKYRALGGENGFLGKPTTGEAICPDGIGRYRHYEGGSIYHNPISTYGPAVIHGDIRAKWASLGYEKSFLGYPISDEMDTPDGGRYSIFDRGYIAWTPQKGARVIGYGQWAGRTDKDMDFLNLQTTAVGDLREFYLYMKDWYKIDLRESYIRKGGKIVKNIKGWQFANFNNETRLNGFELTSGERLVITAAQVLLMQWHFRDLKNNSGARHAQITTYCKGCFKKRKSVKGNWQYHKWCSEFVSYLYKRSGKPADGGADFSFYCNNKLAVRDPGWCVRKVGHFIDYFKKRGRIRSMKDLRDPSKKLRKPQLGDYLYQKQKDQEDENLEHSLMVLGMVNDGMMYVIHGNTGSGGPHHATKSVRVGKWSFNDPNLTGIGRMSFEF